ncbi:MAG: cation-transporting P-type ATPase, partial [Polyangiaceae bacterium]|nr:cation-transporting P-type ATPase [Polyangiaceae bacterium]
MSAILPRRLGAATRALESSHVSAAARKAAEGSAADVFAALGTGPSGLSSEEAERRAAQYGPNTAAKDVDHGRLPLLGQALVNPLVILLTILATISVATGDTRAAVVMGLMVVLGVSLRFVQEARADTAAKKLQAMITVTATVVRDAAAREVPVAELVPGDVVELAAGNMIPADVRLVTAKDLFVQQASLTGESMPVEKFAEAEPTPGTSPVDLKNIGFLGTSVESGSGAAVVVTTGERTYLGSVARALIGQPAPTAFDRGVTRFTWLMIRFIVVMVPLVFLINGLTKGDWKGAFFFAVAVAVGMTPEMLPMIVTVCLTKGAMLMS